MRYGLGWGLSKPWAYIALLNVIWLAVAGVVVIIHMEKTNEQIDDAAPPGDFAFHPDTAFGYGELFCAFMEIAASMLKSYAERINLIHTSACKTTNIILR